MDRIDRMKDFRFEISNLKSGTAFILYTLSIHLNFPFFVGQLWRACTRSLTLAVLYSLACRHAVVFEVELRDGPLLGRVAGDEVLKVGEPARDARLVHAPRRGPRALDAPRVAARALRGAKPERLDRVQPRRRAHEELRGLRLVRVARAPAKLVEHHAPLAVLLDGAPARLLADVRVEESVREAEEVGGEAVAADVRRLPDRLACRAPQGVVQGDAELGAALVALAVRADEEERLAGDDSALRVGDRGERAGVGGGERSEVNRRHVIILLKPEADDRRRALAAADDEEVHARVAPTAVGLDE